MNKPSSKPVKKLPVDVLANDGIFMEIPLDELLLDESNPRFGKQAGNFRGQDKVLDYIVDNFGVDNLLSSLSINGFFSAEPVIVYPDGHGKYIVAEGNRRLAACLILAGDPRAANQQARVRSWSGRAKNIWSKDTRIAARKYEGAEAAARLLPYLGVRHLVASQPWDSYAKAKWIADVVQRQDMTIEQISEVIGDRNRTVERLLEGYHFVNQIIDAGKFNPKNSVRRGRGSNPDFPFSWVYTLLDSAGVRNWLGLGERSSTSKNVLAPAKIEDGASTLRYLLGDSSQGKNPAIADSREIGLLASAIGDENKRALLREGHTAVDIDRLSMPATDLLVDYLNQSYASLTQIQGLLASGKLDKSDAMNHIQRVKQIESLAKSIVLTIVE